MSDDCVFCDLSKIKAQEIEQHFAADSSSVLVFEPLDPVTPGHLLVVPRIHVEDAAADPYVTAMTMSVAARVAQRHRSSNIITSIGRAATQTVMHLHVHVVPRSFNDHLRLPWSGQEERSQRWHW